MAAQENHSELVKFLLANNASQTLATEVSVHVYSAYTQGDSDAMLFRVYTY